MEELKVVYKHHGGEFLRGDDRRSFHRGAKKRKEGHEGAKTRLKCCCSHAEREGEDNANSRLEEQAETSRQIR